MTEIERKALVERLREGVDNDGYDYLVEMADADMREAADRIEALSAENERLVEQHEAFRQEVSDAVAEIAKAWGTADPAWGYLRRFIIAKPDPLVDVIAELGMFPAGKDNADQLRAALAKRGLEIVEKSNG